MQGQHIAACKTTQRYPALHLAGLCIGNAAPVSATSDLAILELHAPGELRAKSLALLNTSSEHRAPQERRQMAGSTRTGHLGTLPREAGVLGLTQEPLCSLPATERCP